MIYMATSTSPALNQAMAEGRLGRVHTPAGGTRNLPPIWCADNGAFSDKWDQDKWWRFLTVHADRADTCLFAVLPDVVADWQATLVRSLPWIDPVKGLGYRVAIVLQDGCTSETVPWEQVDAVFIGGSTAFKLGEQARLLVAEAKRRGLWAHMGRVNSEKRLRYAKHIGCDSADGTFISFGPDVNLPRVEAWLRGVTDQGDLFGEQHDHH